MNVSLRPYVAADGRRCVEIFRAAVAASDQYDDDQREAWASAAADEKGFAGRLARALTILAVVDGAVVGFASLEAGETIDMLYVDPEFTGIGAGTALVDALTRLASARGARRIAVEASDGAKPLFDRQGFVAEKRNLVRVGDEWLANTTMVKTLGDSTPKTRH